MQRSNIACFVTVLLFVLCLLPPSLYSQAEQPLDELTLGLRQRGEILSAHPKVEGTTANVYAEMVFSQLLRTSSGVNGPYLPYEVTIVNDNRINAFSTAAGKVYVTSGILPVLGDDLGVWAAVLSHEVGHTLGQHHYRAYLRAFNMRQQTAYYRARAAQGDKSANWALLGLAIGGRLVNLKLSRGEEHEADRLGLMMMADAGYHPDFATTLYRRMRRKVGDQSKFAAFFSDHPRWATREQRTMKVYNEAVALFDSRWGSPDSSPGGVPPIIATLGHVSTSMDRESKEAIIHVPLNIRNAKDINVTIAVLFHRKKKPVPGALAEYQLEDGSLAAFDTVTPESWNEFTTFALRVPTAALGTKHRKLKAIVAVTSGNEVLESSRPFKVSFPKATRSKKKRRAAAQDEIRQLNK